MNKQYNNIDDLFRDKFDDYEVDPPDYIWDNVKTRIGNQNGKGSGLNKGGITGIILSLVIVGILIVYLLNNSFVVSDTAYDNPMTGEDRPVMIAGNTLQKNIENPVSNSIPGIEKQEIILDESRESTYLDNEKERKSKIRAVNPKRNSTLLIDPVLTAGIPAEREARRSLTVFPVSTGQLLPVKDPGIPPISGEAVTPQPGKDIPGDHLATGETAGSDIVRGQHQPAAEDYGAPGTRNDYGADSRWNVGLYFTPELIVYPQDDLMKNYSYSFDLNASRRFGNYFLQSGLGFARYHEQGNSIVDYNDYLGSYEDVYNVTFDSSGSGVIPVFHTETVQVYDSISHVVISPTKRYFSYLQLPLFIGWGEESRRFGWFVKGGPSISFLVHEENTGSGLGNTRARILSIENELPGRISTNWQFIVSAGVTYKLGSRLRFSMEPMFRYYIKSVYEQDKLNTKHPFSAGLRTGFLLNF